MFCGALGVAILFAGLTSQAHGNEDQVSQDCRGTALASPPARGASPNQITAPSNVKVTSDDHAEQAEPAAVSKARSVKLSWNASIPASNSPADAIKGYNIYRRIRGKSYEKINIDVIRGTSCVDYLVTTRQTYYYQTRAVSATGAVSKPSPEAKAVIPPG
jgi:hypothetical protein